MKSTPLKNAQAAWLYAQFVVSKTVDVKKSQVGLTFIRQSTINHQELQCRTARLEAGRADRVLSQPGAGAVDADRHQCARLS